LIPPTRETTSDELVRVVEENQIDALLFVTLTDYGESEHYVPQSTTTTGAATISGNRANLQAQTYTFGGYSVSKPHAAFQVDLLDAKTGGKAWTTAAKTHGNAYAEFQTLVSSLAKRTVKELIVGGLLVESKPSQFLPLCSTS